MNDIDTESNLQATCESLGWIIDDLTFVLEQGECIDYKHSEDLKACLEQLIHEQGYAMNRLNRMRDQETGVSNNAS